MMRGFFLTVSASITASPLDRSVGTRSSFGPPGPRTIPPFAILRRGFAAAGAAPGLHPNACCAVTAFCISAVSSATALASAVNV